jgi:GNAT superfamily N-acetyltransferase
LAVPLDWEHLNNQMSANDSFLPLGTCERARPSEDRPIAATILCKEIRGMATIRRAIFPDDTASVLGIWREFIANSPVNLDYQGNDAEFVELPGKYAAPSGCALLAERDGEVLGCVAFRKVNNDICEMKRMYVRPYARGNQLGSELIERLIAEARIAGYS